MLHKKTGRNFSQLKIKNKISNITIAIGTAFLLAVTGAIAISSNRPDSDANMIFSTTVLDVSPSISIYLEDGLPDDIYNVTIMPTSVGSVSSISADVKVVADNVYGFDLSIHTTNSGGNMIGLDSGATFAPMAGTINNPIPFDTGGCNSWGFSIAKAIDKRAFIC